MKSYPFFFCNIAAGVAFFVVYNVTIKMPWLAPCAALYYVFALALIFRRADEIK